MLIYHKELEFGPEVDTLSTWVRGPSLLLISTLGRFCTLFSGRVGWQGMVDIGVA